MEQTCLYASHYPQLFTLGAGVVTLVIFVIWLMKRGHPQKNHQLKSWVRGFCVVTLLWLVAGWFDFNDAQWCWMHRFYIAMIPATILVAWGFKALFVRQPVVRKDRES